MVDAIKAMLDELRRDSPPGLTATMYYDTTVYSWFNTGFARLGNRYGGAVGWLARRVPLMLLLFARVLGATVLLYERLLTGFIPPEDSGKFIINVQLPPRPRWSAPRRPRPGSALS